jgi:hypothetical protein
MAPETSPQNPALYRKFDPFSSSWLYPKEWNLSDLQDEQTPASSKDQPRMDGPNVDDLPDELLASYKSQCMPDSYEPFKELRTLPSGWDLS